MYYAELLLVGLVWGCTYALMALGLTLVYGLLRILHVAQASEPAPLQVPQLEVTATVPLAPQVPQETEPEPWHVAQTAGGGGGGGRCSR